MTKVKRLLALFFSFIFTCTIASYTALAANEPNPLNADKIYISLASNIEGLSEENMAVTPRIATCCERPNVTLVTHSQHLPAPDAVIPYCLLILYWTNKECLTCHAIYESPVETWTTVGCGYNCGNF